MKFEDLICEEASLRPHPLTLMDLCGLASRVQQLDGEAPKELPYPGEFVLEELADIYTATGKLHARLKLVEGNALITSNPKAAKSLQNLFVSLSSIKKIIKVMGKQLDSLSIDKLKPDDKIP